MSKPITPACPTCNYDLTGIDPGEDHRITCPECETLLEPTNAPEFSEQTCHQMFRRNFLKPITILSATVLMLSLAPFPIGSLILIAYFISSLVYIPILWMKITQKHRSVPDETERTILNISLFYTLPAAGIYLLLLWRYSVIAISV